MNKWYRSLFNGLICMLLGIGIMFLTKSITEKRLAAGDKVVSEASQEAAKTEAIKIDIGECFVFDYKYNECTPNAPSWENEENALIIYKVVDIGIKKYLVLYKGYYCDLTTAAGSRIYVDTSRIDSMPTTIVDCPDELMPLSKEDIPE